MDLGQLPVQRIHPDRELYRIHRTIHGPLWFAAVPAASGGGRFDLPEESGFGTCYLSASPVGAFLERFGRVHPVTQRLVDRSGLTIVADHYLRHEAPPVTPGVLRVALAGHVLDPSFVGDLDELVIAPYEGFDAVMETHRLILWTDRHLDPLFDARRSRNAVRREQQQAAKQGSVPGLVRCPGFELVGGNLSRCDSWLAPGSACPDHPELPTEL